MSVKAITNSNVGHWLPISIGTTKDVVSDVIKMLEKPRDLQFVKKITVVHVR